MTLLMFYERDSIFFCSSCVSFPPGDPEAARHQDTLNISWVEANHLSDAWGTLLLRRFEWVDGALTRAIEEGRWVLLDNANMCSPTVLDRLNPLLEPAGVLLLNECGTAGGRPRTLWPHPNFRLILALDPRPAPPTLQYTKCMGTCRQECTVVYSQWLWFLQEQSIPGTL